MYKLRGNLAPCYPNARQIHAVTVLLGMFYVIVDVRVSSRLMSQPSPRLPPCASRLFHVFLLHWENLEANIIWQTQVFSSAVLKSPSLYMRPPSTTLPILATSVFTCPLLWSSNSLTTPCTIILRSFKSAFVKSSATGAEHSRGVGTRARNRE